MADNKNQHYVPKTHLKNFSTDKDKRRIDVWLHKHDKLVFGASIKDQCSKSYIYGKDLTVEEFFQYPEQLFGSLIPKLSQQDCADSNSLRQLLFFWLLQYIRSERALTEQLFVMNAMRDMISLGQENNTRLKDWLGPPSGTPEAMRIALDSAKDVFDVISDLRCALLVNRTGTCFVMSDNPAVSSNKLVLKRYMHYRNWGLESAGLYVYMPLTPHLGFIAYDKDVYELNGRNGNKCVLREADVIALNQLIYLFSNNIIVIPPNNDLDITIKYLKEVNFAKPERTLRLNLAVEDEQQERKGSTKFSGASVDEFAKAKTRGLIHLESIPPVVPRHFPKLQIKQMPKFIDTNSGAGLKRYGRIRHQLSIDASWRSTA